MTGQFLLWGVCFGARCATLGQLWAESICKIGGWRHDIVVLGDQMARALEPRGVRVIAVDRQTLPPGWTDQRANSLKPTILFHVDVTRYDYLLYLDMDVLVNSDRLTALVASKQRKGLIAVQRDIVCVSANRRFTGRDTLTAEEKLRFAGEAFCAGIVGVPGTARGLGLLRHWHEANRAAGFSGSDQARLIALLLRQYHGAWEYMGDTVIGRRAERYPETLVHFSARRDDLMRNYGRSVLRLQATT